MIGVLDGDQATPTPTAAAIDSISHWTSANGVRAKSRGWREHIYRKLGFTGRTAALAALRGTRTTT